MKKLDAIGRITNVILGVVYVPLSAFSFLALIAEETLIGKSDPLLYVLVYSFCTLSFVNMFMGFFSITLSAVLRQKGRSVASFLVQFLPLGVFGLSMLLLLAIEAM